MAILYSAQKLKMLTSMLIPGKLYRRKNPGDAFCFIVTKTLDCYYVDSETNLFCVINKNDTLMFLGSKTVKYSKMFPQERYLFLTNNKLISFDISNNPYNSLDLLC